MIEPGAFVQRQRVAPNLDLAAMIDAPEQIVAGRVVELPRPRPRVLRVAYRPALRAVVGAGYWLPVPSSPWHQQDRQCVHHADSGVIKKAGRPRRPRTRQTTRYLSYGVGRCPFFRGSNRE
jgi:hypothetical protein